MALKWPGGSNVDHPMANPVQARQIVARLPVNDAAKALEEITEWLDSLNRAEGFKADRLYECVDLLDGAARRHQLELTQEYLSTLRGQKFLENWLWNAEFGFCKQLGDAYVRCIKECVDGQDGSSAVQIVLPALVARALRSLAQQLKWIMLRYGFVEQQIWAQLALLYRLAEEKEITDLAIAVYPGAHGESTVKREFLKVLMLPASSLDGLTPVKQQIAERAVAHFAESFVLSAKPHGCTHSFDPEVPMPPERVVPGVAPAGLLYFGAGVALARIDQLVEKIAALNGVPQEFNLGGNYPKEEVILVLRRLAQCWSDQAPARTSERRPTAARFTVVPGAVQVFGALEPSTGNNLDFSQNQTAESWIVESVSDNGYGAIVPTQKIDWVRIGVLIGMKSESSNYLGIGLIRRITRDAHQQRRVGIQVLTKTAIPVTIWKTTTMSSLNFGLVEETAILLTIKPDARGEVDLLLRVGIFKGRDILEMTLKERNYQLVPASIIEAGEDYYWARFKVTQRSA